MSNHIDVSELEQVRLPDLNSFLKKTYGLNWGSLEVETIQLDLGVVFSNLLLDKIWVLKLCNFDKDLIWEDLNFFSHFIKVSNNQVADFDYFPICNSLELAWGLIEAMSVIGVPKEHASTSVSDYIKHC